MLTNDKVLLFFILFWEVAKNPKLDLIFSPEVIADMYAGLGT